MKAYKLKAGRHVVLQDTRNTDGMILAVPGDVIVSNTNLVRQNGEDKFEELPGDPHSYEGAHYDKGCSKPEPVAEGEENKAPEGSENKKSKKTVA